MPSAVPAPKKLAELGQEKVTAEKEDKETDVKKKRVESGGRLAGMMTMMTTTQFIFPVANVFNIGRSQCVQMSHGVTPSL